MDWSPPSGMKAISRAWGGTSNPFAFGPLWLGQMKPVEPMLPETMEVPSSSPQMIGSVEKADAKGSSSTKGLKSLKELPKAWWREAASDRGGYQ